MKTTILYSSLIVLLTSTIHAVDFDWKPGEVSAEVKPADKVNIGQYLYIKRDTQNAGTWNMAKLNLPESWKIKSVKVEGLKIHVVTDGSGKFEITPKNLKELWNKLRKAKQGATDEELQKIWKAKAASGGSVKKEN